MKTQKPISQRALDFDLNDEEIQQIKSNDVLAKEIYDAYKADDLSKELFLPGYAKLVSTKQHDLTKALDTIQSKARTATSNHKNRRGIVFKLLSVAATIVVLVGLIIQPWQESTVELTSEEISIELKSLAMLSFESTGFLDNDRGESTTDSEFLANYSFIKDDNCENLNINDRYKEQKLLAELYCSYQHNDMNSVKLIANEIINNQYPNYGKVEGLLNKILKHDKSDH